VKKRVRVGLRLGAKQLRQFSDIGGDPASFVFGHQVGAGAPPQLAFVVDARHRKAVRVFDNEARAVGFLERPGRREATVRLSGPIFFFESAGGWHLRGKWRLQRNTRRIDLFVFLSRLLHRLLFLFCLLPQSLCYLGHSMWSSTGRHGSVDLSASESSTPRPLGLYPTVRLDDDDDPCDSFAGVRGPHDQIRIGSAHRRAKSACVRHGCGSDRFSTKSQPP
jgi:hypothetical protein